MNKSRLTTAVVNVLIAATFTAASAGSSLADSRSALVPNGSASMFSPNEDVLSSLQTRFGEDLVLVGQVDAFSDAGEAIVLGQRVAGAAGPGLRIGDYIAVLGQPAVDGRVEGLLVYQLSDSYVPGASRILIRGVPTSDLSSSGYAEIGNQKIDLTPAMSRSDLAWLGKKRGVVSVVGIQPLPNGVVLASEATTDGSLGTGKVRGSLGTGKVDGSLGTGKVNGSLGTGKVDGSLGTGKANGSLGTGKVDGSLGTG